MPGKLVVRNLVKQYGHIQAVRGVSFEVAEGEIFGLLGPNGAGKTTTVECIVGLRRPDDGSIELCGFDALKQTSAVKERVGVALQSTSLQDKITPREALDLFGSFYSGRSGDKGDAKRNEWYRDRRGHTAALISRFSLDEKADSTFDSLSGGQRQRLALAMAFVNEPELVFLDEPTTGLDPQSRRDLHADILQMRAEGRTVVLTTHYIEEAHALCDRVGIVDHGRVIAIGKPDELIAASKAMPRVCFRTARPLDSARMAALPTVKGARLTADQMVLHTTNVSQTMMDVLRTLTTTENELLDVQIQRPSLEDVFIELTGSSLRD